MNAAKAQRKRENRKLARAAKHKRKQEQARARRLARGLGPRQPKDKFIASAEWRALRKKVLSKYGPRCMCCGHTPEGRGKPNVDHIKPRKLFPELALDECNLQVLCARCNKKKGNSHQTDYRELARARAEREATAWTHIADPKATEGLTACGCGDGVMKRWAGGAALRCTACQRTEWMPAANDEASEAARCSA